MVKLKVASETAPLGGRICICSFVSFLNFNCWYHYQFSLFFLWKRSTDAH